MPELNSRVLHPFEIARRPNLEPEVRRAILARWSSIPSRNLDAQEILRTAGPA